MWLGPVHSEARAAFQRSRTAGLSPMRALVIGCVASFKECWAFRRKLAEKVGCSVRTVQRALTQARTEGLIGLARAKKDEVPKGWEHGPITCGWSHRWTIGWGLAGAKVHDAVHAAKARWMVKIALAKPKATASATVPPPAVTYKAKPARPMTPDELDADLMAAVTAARDASERRKKPPPS
jgi:DNA-binding transcriptional MocR family regulator